jgi:Transglutaminase-like superfamily
MIRYKSVCENHNVLLKSKQMNKIQKFLHLDSSEKYLLIGAFLLLNSIRVGFLFLKFPLLQQILGRISKLRSDVSTKSVISIERIVWCVEVSTQLSPGGAKCLARALTVETLMKQNGYAPSLKIGVIKNSIEEFKAHAWIEHQGKIVIGGDLPDLNKYSSLDPI